MSSREDLLKAALKEHGYSVTTARKTVFAALDQQEPQTMKELVGRINGVIDRASIYRTIALFESLGIVQRLQIGWKYKLELSDAFHYHHHHLSCIRCGRIIPLRDDLMLEARIEHVATEYGYKTVSHQLEIQGLCPTCQHKS